VLVKKRKEFNLSDEELEAIRKRKMLNLQQQMVAENQKDEEKLEYERQKTEILRKLLTADARSRLTNIKIVKPQLADQIEMQIISLAQTGQLNKAGIEIPITDEQLKIILSKIQSKKRDINIKFK
jgi:programmed cell death protein 5